MARELVPIKVKILRKSGPNGMTNDYPDFNSLAPAVRGGLDWSKFVDDAGGGWHYDKTDGFGEGAVPGEMFGCLLVPVAFADAVKAAFPALITELTEAEFADFHDNKAHAHEPENKYDVETLQGMVAVEALGGTVNAAEKTAALDRDNEAPGIRRNKKKLWTDRKAAEGVTIKTGR